MKKKSAQKVAGWATAHLSHDTMDCIVTQGSWAQMQRPLYGKATPTTRRGKRKESQSSSTSGKKQRASSSCGFQGSGHLGQGQIRVASQAGQMVCYHCQQPEHIRRDCP